MEKMSRCGMLVMSASSLLQLVVVVVLVLILGARVSTAQWKEQSLGDLGPLLKKNQRFTIFSTEYGAVSEARVTDGNQAFQLHFITLEPNSLFLPVLLHYDMVFFVQTGSGRLSYLDKDEKEHRALRGGDVHRLRSGTVFFIQSDLDNERQKLRIIAIFDNPEYGFNGPASGPYSSVSDLVLGFDETVLSEAFKAPEQLIEELKRGTRPVAIIHGLQQKKKKKNRMLQETEYEFMEDMFRIFHLSNKDKKSKLFNVYDKDPDVKNENGWSTFVGKKKYGPLKGSKYSVFIVYLVEGKMMGPHWNPEAIELAVAIKGKGMVHVVCPRMMDASDCSDSRYLVEEGDVFVVPRFHAMAQIAFDNETFVFMGFSTSTSKNHPQYLAGKASVPRTLDKHIMAASLGINVSTFDELWGKQDMSVLLNCTSCAEEEWVRLLKEIEEERQREEEEARKKEEEERREEEAARKKEEEEAKKREEEAERQKEAAAQIQRQVEEALRRWAEGVKKWQEQQQREQEERERQEQQQKQEEEERERQEQQQKQEEEERERQEQQQKQEEEERERQEQQQQEQEEWAERERERERAQEAEREREAQAKKEEEAAKGQGQWRGGQGEQEEWTGEEAQAKREEAAKGQGQWGGGQEEQEEWTGEEAQARREQEAAKAAAAQGQGQEQWREHQGEPVSQE